jgi:hypothetical protein
MPVAKCNDFYLHIQEPFIGVAVGGQRIPGGKPGNLLVWAITAQGRVRNHLILVWIVTVFILV